MSPRSLISTSGKGYAGVFSLLFYQLTLLTLKYVHIVSPCIVYNYVLEFLVFFQSMRDSKRIIRDIDRELLHRLNAIETAVNNDVRLTSEEHIEALKQFMNRKAKI